MAVQNHVGLIVTNLTGVAGSTVINAKSISWITNEDPNQAILFNFEEGTNTSGAFKIGTGLTVRDINVSVGTIYYTSTGATAASFSLFGLAQ